MKRFMVQAIIDERHLWELMAYLEKHRAEGILARPYLGNGAAAPEKKDGRSLNKVGQRPKGTGMRGEVTAAILAAIKDGGKFSVGEMRKQYAKFPSTAVYAAVNRLLDGGVLKRTAPGEYAAGRKAAAAIEASKAVE